jgi:HK97 gp10 family phage protein
MNEIHIAPADLQKALNDIAKYGKNVQEGAKKEVLRTAYSITNKAKGNCPVRTGGLRSSLSVKSDVNELQAKSGTNMHYAPYVEFGTGTLVDVPEGLKEYAMQFKGKGIRKVNLRARPFLFPAAESERPKFVERMQKILNGPK